jgi:hypothetical protein
VPEQQNVVGLSPVVSPLINNYGAYTPEALGSELLYPGVSDISGAGYVAGVVAAFGDLGLTGTEQIPLKVSDLDPWAVTRFSAGDVLGLQWGGTATDLEVAGPGALYQASLGSVPVSGILPLNLGGSERDNSGVNVGLGTGVFGNLAVGGNNNTAFGYQALFDLTTGDTNSAFGYRALFDTSTSSYNTAMGYRAGYLNTGVANAYFGYDAGYSGVTASEVVAIGFECARSNTADYTVAVGTNALWNNTSGLYNTAVGAYALSGNGGTAVQQTALGYSAGTSCAGSYNTLVGAYAGFSITNGQYNTAVGRYAYGSI